MPTNPQSNKNYPNLENYWRKNLPQIDAQITEFCATCSGDPQQQLGELKEHIEGWFEDQDLDNAALTEFEKARLDPQYLQNQVGTRLGHLIQQGIVGQPQTMQAGGSSGGGGQYKDPVKTGTTTPASQAPGKGKPSTAAQKPKSP
jgi:hypothetical protein